MKQILGKLWTDSVAYVALFAGAGLSIAGNVADVRRVRGEAMDSLDVTMAVVYPALVVLMVEVFVNGRWRGLPWPMQCLRWAGCGLVTAVAMRVSWVHLNELMLTRGQKPDVAVLGPLAIDFLAIMATALILAGRGQDRRSSEAPSVTERVGAVIDTLATGRYVTAYPAGGQESPVVNGHLAKADDVPDTIPNWMDGLANRVRDGAHTPAVPVPDAPVSPAAPSNRVRPEGIPAEAVTLIAAWRDADPAERPAEGQADQLVAAATGRSVRTARRWRVAMQDVAK